jgi:NADH-quinone oxidoreductase subunit N
VSAFTLELGLAALMLVIFFAGMLGDAGRRRAGEISAGGLLVLLVGSLVLEPGSSGGRGVSASWDDARAGLELVFVQDALALFAKQVFLLATFIGAVASLAPVAAIPFRRRATEYHLLMLCSLLGMMVLASARDLILLFVAFELMSIPLYVLAGFVKRDPIAIEASLKFFLLGSVSSAVMAYGLSFVYGIAGTTALPGVARASAAGHPLLTLGLLAVLAGFGFKIAAFPFHMWVPDTYEAASTPFVAWLSVAPKAAGFVAIFRVYVEGTGGRVGLWVSVAAGLAAVTIVVGNLMALPQQNVKRLLAYSGVAHIGYMLVGFAALSPSGTGMVLFYLVAYVLGNMGAFLVVEAVSRSEGSEHLDAFRGLAQRSPLLALAMLLFLLSLGGIPFVAGFWAKLYVFWAAAQAGLYWLVLVGAVLTVVALFYYLLIARRMYIDPPARPGPVPVTGTLAVSVVLCVLGVVALGLYPKPLVMAALAAAAGLF